MATPVDNSENDITITGHVAMLFKYLFHLTFKNRWIFFHADDVTNDVVAWREKQPLICMFISN